MNFSIKNNYIDKNFHNTSMNLNHISLSYDILYEIIIQKYKN